MREKGGSAGVRRGWALKNSATAETGKISPGAKTMYNFESAFHRCKLTCYTMQPSPSTCCSCCQELSCFQYIRILIVPLGGDPTARVARSHGLQQLLLLSQQGEGLREYKASKHTRVGRSQGLQQLLWLSQQGEGLRKYKASKHTRVGNLPKGTI
jgi:hypothetical protein